MISNSFLTVRDLLSNCNYLKVCANYRVRSLIVRDWLKCFSKLDIRKFSFSYRVDNEWDSLPEWVINHFRTLLQDKHSQVLL